MELTEAQRRQLVAVLTLWEPSRRPPTREQLRAYLFGPRRNTGASVSRIINALEEKGAVTVTWSATENAEVITPTNEGRNAL